MLKFIHKRKSSKDFEVIFSLSPINLHLMYHKAPSSWFIAFEARLFPLSRQSLPFGSSSYLQVFHLNCWNYFSVCVFFSAALIFYFSMSILIAITTLIYVLSVCSFTQNPSFAPFSVIIHFRFVCLTINQR